MNSWLTAKEAKEKMLKAKNEWSYSDYGTFQEKIIDRIRKSAELGYDSDCFIDFSYAQAVKFEKELKRLGYQAKKRPGKITLGYSIDVSWEKASTTKSHKIYQV